MRSYLKGSKNYRLIAVVILGLAVLSVPGFVLAAGGASNSLSWGSGQPTPGKGQVSGSGTYTVAAGWTASSVTMTAIPTGGGKGYTGTGNQPAGGNWGPVTITGLPTGQYSVYAYIVFRQAGQTPQTVYSAIAIVNVQ